MSRHVLVFAAPQLQRLREELLQAAPLESAAFAFARPVRTPRGRWRLVVHDWYLVGNDDYDRRNEVSIDLPPRVVAAAIKLARETQSALVLVHSHPGSDPTPSQRDRDGESRVVLAFERRVPDTPVVRLILSSSTLSAAVLRSNAAEEPAKAIEVGADLSFSRSVESGKSVDSRFDRQVRAFGEDGQAILRRLSIAIIGLGGTGSVAAQQLAYLGVRKFLLVEPELVDETNTTRIVGSTLLDVGKPKVDVAAAMIRRIDPSACIEVLRADVQDQRVLRTLLDADFFICCTDSQGSRAVLTQLAYQYLLPGIDMGVVIHASDGEITHISGRVQMLAPGLACLLCSAVLDPEQVRRDLLTEEARAADSYIVGGVAPQPAVISINSATVSFAITMLLSAVTGVPVSSRHQRLRLDAGIVSSVHTTPLDECPWCSHRGAFSRGDSWPMPGRAS